MDKDIRKYLYDILVATKEVEQYFRGRPKRYEDFVTNYMLRRAIERNIEIMGEATNRILKIDENIAISNARKIVDARNYVIHGYDRLSPDILWSIVINHLPLLQQEVETLLGITEQ